MQAAPAPSRWHQSPEAERQRLERHDGHAHLRNKLREIANAKGEWAGIPMPLEGEALVVEPTYPHAQALMAMCAGKPPEPHEADGAIERNRWYSMRRRCDIHIFTLPDGKIDWGITPAFHSLGFALSTLNCAEAWGIEQESNALELLAGLISHHQFKQYLLTGMFIEGSKRSKVFYLFRRLKPTVAIRANNKGTTSVMCALCLHPIAYYARSWAGAMTPTDDVVAHLMLMRGDEPRFWRKSTQHPSWRPEAGL